VPYIDGRLVHDADAHVVETPDWLIPFADPELRERMPQIGVTSTKPGESEYIEKLRLRHADPEYVANEAEEIMQRKNWAATGSFIKEDRGRALDLIGVQSQLLFNTFLNGLLNRLEHAGDAEFCAGVARAHNRAMLDFCSADSRLLATGYVPLVDIDAAASMATEVIRAGARALLVPSACPASHSPSHIGLDRVWAQAQEAQLPVVFHVGGGGTLLDPNYFSNGLPAVKDFHGGDENFRSIDYMAIPYPPMQTVATLILDGVLDRFPGLKIGVIEQGASWVPGWMRQLDSAFDAFRRGEERLQQLSMRPSEFVKRQIRVTPYPSEDLGWIIEQAGEEICLFSTDYPHVEGGRNPIRRFESTTEKLPESALQRFYWDNFIDLMGAGLN
jgi:predicted TIM-barrel fold metal-dependent hydrolase